MIPGGGTFFLDTDNELTGSLGIKQDLAFGGLRGDVRTPNTFGYAGNLVLSTPSRGGAVLYATGAAPVWAMLLSMAITAVSAFGVAMLAGAIYSRSILESGKRVSWRDAVRRGPATGDAAAVA